MSNSEPIQYNAAAVKLAEAASNFSTALPKLIDRLERLEVEVSSFSNVKLKGMEVLIQSEVKKLELLIQAEIEKIEVNIHEVLPSVRREVDRVETTNKQVLEAIESRLQGVRDSLDGVRNGSDSRFQGVIDSLDGVRKGSDALTNQVENRLNSLATKDDLSRLREDIAALKATSISPMERVMMYLAVLAMVVPVVGIWISTNPSFQPSVQKSPSQLSVPQQKQTP